MAEAGIRLIWGGGAVGLMGTVARAVLDHGGRVTGIIPQFLVDRELAFDGADEMIVTDDMHVRKRQMFERADAFVALPGGIGTLEELVEQMTWAQLGRHRKPILIANIAGFWDPLLALIDHMRDERLHPPAMGGEAAGGGSASRTSSRCCKARCARRWSPRSATSPGRCDDVSGSSRPSRLRRGEGNPGRVR